MDILQTIVLAVVQGISEFLPISSSAHLILVPELLGWAQSGLAFDVAVHVGTLIAVIVFLKKELARIVPAWLIGWSEFSWSNDGKLGWLVIVATIPVGIVGLLFVDYIEMNLRNSTVIAITTLVFGVLLGIADIKGAQNTTEKASMTFKHASIIGLSQALALIPGTSRSGVTMTVLLMLGYTRTAAAKFSFLMAIPAIALPGILKSAELTQSQTPVEWGSLLLGMFVSAGVALVTMRWFINLVNRTGMLPFVIYRIVLAGLIYLLLV